MSSNSSFDTNSVVLTDPKIFFFFLIPTSTADAAGVNPNGIKTLLANGLIAFFINGSPIFNNERRSLQTNPT